VTVTVQQEGSGASYVARSRALGSAREARELYDDWAATYDDDLTGPAGDDYPLPGVVADIVAGVADTRADILDAACGTGLVGAALARRGFSSVDGLDVSPRMLARARARQVYHDLGPADLSERVPGPGDKFGVLTCINAFEPGHLPRSALAEFARVVHRGGHIVVSVGVERRGEIEKHLQQLRSRQVARVQATSEVPVRVSTGECHVVAVLEVMAASQSPTRTPPRW
jgi:predicted TPR repeat methyltransferase